MTTIVALVVLAIAQTAFWSVRLRKMRKRYETLREDWCQAVERAESKRAQLLIELTQFRARCPQCGHAVPSDFLEHENLGGIFGNGSVLTACRTCLYGEAYPHA